MKTPKLNTKKKRKTNTMERQKANELIIISFFLIMIWISTIPLSLLIIF